MNALRQGFLKHNQHIRDVVPKEKLLVWHPKDGWDPLCSFLGKPVPAEPLPKVNEGMFTAQIFQYLVFLRLVEFGKALLKVAVPAAVAAGGWWWYRRNY